MIQRIQSLWLALAVVCIALCFFLPVAKYQFADKSVEGHRFESQFGLLSKEVPDLNKQMVAGEPVVLCKPMVEKMPVWPLLTLAIVSGVLGLVSIFLFKKRRVQIRVVMLGFMATLIYVFVLFFWAVDKYANVLSSDEMLQRAGIGATPEVTWAAGAFIPMAALVFFFLAQRSIRKDEAMVRAADRLR